MIPGHFKVQLVSPFFDPRFLVESVPGGVPGAYSVGGSCVFNDSRPRRLFFWEKLKSEKMKRVSVKAYKPSSTNAARQRQLARIQGARSQVMQHNLAFSSRARAAMLSKELGFVDVAAATYGCDTTGSVTLLSDIAQGASVNQRVGKKTALKSLQVRGNLVVGTTSTICDTAVLIVYDRRPTGALPAITAILVSASASALNNDANSGRFKIIRRWDNVLCGNSTTPATGKEILDLNDFIDLKMRPCIFKAAATGDIDDIEEGALYLVTVGNQAAGATAASANLAFRLRFVDV